MTNKHHRRRGMTLAEIMICIAVVAIAVVMVTSFSVTMGTRMSQSKAQLEAREELEALEELTDAWLNAVLDEGKTQPVTFVRSTGQEVADETITVLLGKEPAEGEQDTRVTLTLDWQYNRLIGARPGTDAEGNPVPPIVFRTEHVIDMRFFVKPSTEWVDEKVPEVDANGDPLLDASGNPVYKENIKYDGQGNEIGREFVTVPVEKTVEGGDMLFYCKVTFEIPMGNAKQPIEQTHIFCINPHMGDTVN